MGVQKIIAFFMLVTGLSLVACLPPQPPTLEPISMATLEPIVTPDPTATLEPTVTPDPTATLEPTVTPDPTATLEPTATPTNTPTSTSTPILPTNTPAPLPSPTSWSSVPCDGNISEELIEQAWLALDSQDYAKIVSCTQKVINGWSSQADAQQAEKAEHCTYTPPPDNLELFNAYWESNWALNDIAIAWYLHGEAFHRQGMWVEAGKSYQVIVDRYSCAYAWDPNQILFWRIYDAAQERLRSLP